MVVLSQNSIIEVDKLAKVPSVFLFARGFNRKNTVIGLI